MMLTKYRYTDTEIKELLQTIVIIVDTREQANEHILNYFDSKKVQHISRKLEYGDYSAYLPRNEKYGIMRNIHFDISIERKNSVDELASTIKERTRFENELIRSQKSRFQLVVEDAAGYKKIIYGEYRSKYDAKALLASLKAFEARYNFNTVFIQKELLGNYIYHEFYYMIREYLKA